MRSDLARLTSAPATAPPPPKTAPRPRAPTAPETTPISLGIPATTPAEMPDPPVQAASAAPPVALTGKNENELRALFGAPTSEEDRPPGKRWRYHNGQCTLDVQLYPDVRTKQFGTLAYEVKSDDNSDEGKRLCLARLQSRAQTRN